MNIPAPPSIIQSPSSAMPASGVGGNYQDLAKWAAVMRQQFPKHMEGFMKQGIASAVEQCIVHTPPYVAGVGGKTEGIKSGTERLEEEINKVFRPIQDLPFKEVIAMRNWEAIATYGFKFKNPRLEEAMNSRKLDVLENAFKVKNIYLSKVGQYIGEADAKIHQSQRGRDGRIVKNPNVYYVKNKAEVQRYVAQSLAYIGKMVGGWYQCLAQLGAPKKNPYPHPGSGQVTVSGVGSMNITVTAINHYGDFNKLLTSNADMQAIVDGAAKHAMVGIQTSLQQLSGTISVSGQTPGFSQSYSMGGVGALASTAWQQIPIDTGVFSALRFAKMGPGAQSGMQIASGAMPRGYTGDSAVSGSPD